MGHLKGFLTRHSGAVSSAASKHHRGLTGKGASQYIVRSYHGISREENQASRASKDMRKGQRDKPARSIKKFQICEL